MPRGPAPIGTMWLRMAMVLKGEWGTMALPAEAMINLDSGLRYSGWIELARGMGIA